ncbi:MAG: hypothetical protein VB051_13095 [Candidatus Pelethousia sp.]|nr:hypothetical protein [Candidatus Pelethousia sp.]
MDRVEHVYDKTKLYLALDTETENQSGEYLYFDLMADDPDASELCEEFKQIVYDIISHFASGHVVLYGAGYGKLKAENRKWFGRGWNPGKFNTKGATSRLKQYLIDTKWNDGIFADVVDFHQKKLLWRMERYYYKELYILQEKLDMELFRKTDVTLTDGKDYGIGIAVFPQSKMQRAATDEETIVLYRNRGNAGVILDAPIDLPRICIAMNKNYMPVDDLIAQLRSILQKYYKILEVDL